MTLKELSQLYWLNREIESDRKRLEKLEQEATSVSSPRFDGMPHTPGYQNSKIENYVAEIVDLKAIIAAKQQQCIYERNRLERYIADIPDSHTRQIFKDRFVEGMSWPKVAHSIGGNNTTDSVKKICYRYIKKNYKKT